MRGSSRRTSAAPASLNEIVHFTDGTRAIDYLFNHANGPALGGPSLVLLDLNLPDMSGADILAKIKGAPALRRTPVVVLTTTDDKVEIERCYDLGANVYITKPVNYESFAQAIRQLGLFLSVIKVPDAETQRAGDQAAKPESRLATLPPSASTA